jgi:hypothetical protein
MAGKRGWSSGRVEWCATLHIVTSSQPRAYNYLFISTMCTVQDLRYTTIRQKKRMIALRMNRRSRFVLALQPPIDYTQSIPPSQACHSHNQSIPSHAYGLKAGTVRVTIDSERLLFALHLPTPMPYCLIRPSSSLGRLDGSKVE